MAVERSYQEELTKELEGIPYSASFSGKAIQEWLEYSEDEEKDVDDLKAPTTGFGPDKDADDLKATSQIMMSRKKKKMYESLQVLCLFLASYVNRRYDIWSATETVTNLCLLDETFNQTRNKTLWGLEVKLQSLIFSDCCNLSLNYWLRLKSCCIFILGFEQSLLQYF